MNEFRYIRKIKSEKQIRNSFENSIQRVFSFRDLQGIIENHRVAWQLAATTPVRKIIERLEKNDILKIQEIPFENGDKISRYIYGSPTVYEMAASFHKGSYISHYPAVFINNLTTQVPKTIYVTHELTPKIRGEVDIDQESIDAAFSRPQRRSEKKMRFGDYYILILSGMFTSNTGIIAANQDRRFPFTNMERTLVDITVRPNYAGGCFLVLEAFKRAIEQDVSINKISAILNGISFIYPYHQALGFYLERAGYKGKLLSLFKKQPMHFDFYLDYQLQKPAYSKEWRIFYPSQM